MTVREKVVPVDRTSGDEGSTGQSPREQLALTVALAREAFEPVGEFGDADVPGDSVWESRPGLCAARALADQMGAPIFCREVSRLWRGEPGRGLALLETLPALEVYGEPVFSRRGGAWLRDSDGDHLQRFVALWVSWSEKRRIKTRTGQVMGQIAKGERKTESGRPPGRPVVEIDAEHVAAARAVIESGGSLTDAREKVREMRGFYAVKDPEARKKRDVGKGTLGRALGLPGYVTPAQKADPPKTHDAPAGDPPARKGSLVGEQVSESKEL